MEHTDFFVWGSDYFGQLGLGSSSDGRVYPYPKYCRYSINIIKIACGDQHSCFISNRGHIYSIGNNFQGQLGLGTTQLQFTSTPCLIESLINQKISDISCRSHTLACSQTGKCFTWGLGRFDALGTGQSQSQFAPVQIQIRNVLKVAAGSRHSGAITERGVYMWGSGDAGQLANGQKNNEIYPKKISMNQKVKDIALGKTHSLFLCQNGKILASGNNSGGQLGIGSKQSSMIPIAVRGLEKVYIQKIDCGSFSAGVSDRGELFVWGTGEFGEFLKPKRLIFEEKIAAVSLGNGFGVVLDMNGKVYSWGNNQFGELGLGDYQGRDGPELVKQIKNKKLQSIVCGGSFCIGFGQKENNLTESQSVLEDEMSRVQLIKNDQTN